MGATHFDELTVARLTIVDAEGKRRLVLAGPGVPPGVVGGRTLHTEERWPGILFYNEAGDECGGLIFRGAAGDEGSASAGASLTFDRWRQDQVLQLLYSEEGGKHLYGVIGVDRPTMPLPEMMDRYEEARAADDSEAMAELGALNPMRFFLGRSRQGEAVLQLCDSKGKPRIRLWVDGDDDPKLQFLDAEGDVTFTLPPEA